MSLRAFAGTVAFASSGSSPIETGLRYLGHEPFILLFLVVAAGYALGRVKIKKVGLGATASTLVIGLAVSLLAVRAHDITLAIPEFASTLFFNLFMFSVGMKVGPQFISGLRRDAGKFIFMGLFIPFLSLALLFAVRRLFHLPPGMLVGMFAGSNTATPGLGSAEAAYSTKTNLPPGVNVTDVVANLSTAFAFTYCISVVIFTILMKVPDLLGRSTANAAKAFEESIRGADDAPLPGVADEFLRRPLPVVVRAYEIERPNAVGHPLRELRAKFPDISVERVGRGKALLEPVDDIVLQLHDTISIHGAVELVSAAGGRIGHEVFESRSRDIGSEIVDTVAYHPDVVGKTLGELAAGVGHGLYLNAMFRGGEAIPHGPSTVVRKGDVLRITGSPYRIRLLERSGAHLIKPSVSTDLVTLALGLAVGGLLGSITVHFGSIKLTLGSSVGLLLTGIFLSTMRTRYPALGGPFPEPARQLLEDLGLNVFIAILGINSGAGVIKAIQQGAFGPILVGCLVVGFVPPLLAWFIGERRMRMNVALLLGAVAGGRCNSPGMRAAQEASQSTVPAISYPVTFAISNIVFTVMSYVLALLN